MAANANSDRDKDDRSEENPFVSFRRYADSQFASMLDGILGLPQTLYQKGHEHGRGLSQRGESESEPQSATTGPEKATRKGGYGRDSDGNDDDDESKDDRRADEEDDNWDTGDWNKLAERLFREMERDEEREREMADASPAAACEDTSGQTRSDGERGWAEWFWGADADPRNTKRQDQTDMERKTCPYLRPHEDAIPPLPASPPRPFPCALPFGTTNPTSPFFPGGSLLTLPSLVFRGPGTNFEMLPYLFLSPYSPLHLERDPHLGQVGAPRWRTAFEDLCRASQGRELTGEKEWERIERESGVEWVAGLVPEVDAAEGMRRPESRVEREDEEDVNAWDPMSAVRKMLDDDGMESRLLRKIAALRQEAERVDAEWSRKPEGQPGADRAQRNVPQPQSAIGRFLADSIVEGESKILRSIAAARQEAERLGAEWTQEVERWSGHASQGQRQTPSKPPRPAQEDESKFANDASAEPVTELDAYERLLGSGLHDSPARTPRAAEPGQSSVLSTITTTERRVLPDGSVTTKVVLRKRFADGREEREETVHTTQGQGQGPGQPQRSRIESGNVVGGKRGGQVEQDGGDEGQKERRRGWFWSS